MSEANTQVDIFDVLVVGAGLGGLATATAFARAGSRVLVCERARHPGGRGRTRSREGFSLNLGAHALYRRGPAMAMLRELDIEPRGGAPSVRGILRHEGRDHLLPTGPLSILSSGAFCWSGKLELLRFFTRISRFDAAAHGGISAAAWLEGELRDPVVRAYVGALIRLSSYCGELERISADAAIAQVQLALGGVLYLDGGWQQLVDALVERAEVAGVELRFGAGVRRVSPARGAGAGQGARFEIELDGARVLARDLVVAASPGVAARLLDAPDLVETVPVRGAALDLGLRGPWPGPTFAVDLDEPIYLSLGSAVAALAPEGHEQLSLVWYRREQDEGRDPQWIRGRLEAAARRLCPDLDERVVVAQFLPDLVVAHDRPRPATGGLGGRQSAHPREGVHLVGDWVGERGLLLDASLASAAMVVESLLGDRRRLRASA